jgi:uncharacterized membrane protein YfcA
VDIAHAAWIGGAALVAGVVNAIAGGGSLITFPVLVASGMSPVIASVTNTVAMCPGYFGATVAQRRELAGQRARAQVILPAGALGGVVGALVLLHTGDAAFAVVVPFLILFAAGLLAFQDRIRTALTARGPGHGAPAWAALAVGVAAIYGGYFGAGLGVIVLAALAVVLDDSLTRLNALKQTVSLVVNVAAAAVFVGSGRVDWTVAAVMAVAALVGGAIGGAIASRVPAALLKWAVVATGVVVSAIYFVRI